MFKVRCPGCGRVRNVEKVGDSYICGHCQTEYFVHSARRSTAFEDIRMPGEGAIEGVFNLIGKIFG